MSTVISDTTLQATASKNRQGYRIIREMVISDVAGSSTGKPWTALGDPSIPNTIGTPHPDQPLALLQDVTASIAESGSPNIYRVILTYETQQGRGSGADPVYEFGAISNQVEVGWRLLDATANPPTAKRLFVNGRDDEAAETKQAVTVTAELFQPTITVTRYETGIDPLEIVQLYTNRINSEPWMKTSGESDADNIGSWLCNDIRATTADFELDSYQMTYSFIKAPYNYVPNTDEEGTLKRNWQLTAFYLDENGVFPINQLDFNAPHVLQFDFYNSTDFNILGI